MDIALRLKAVCIMVRCRPGTAKARSEIRG